MTLGTLKSHTWTVLSALALARRLRTFLFQDRARTESVWPSIEVGVASSGCHET